MHRETDDKYWSTKTKELDHHHLHHHHHLRAANWWRHWVWSRGSGPSASTGRRLAGIPTGGRPFLTGLKLRGDEPGEGAGERTGRRGGPGAGCWRASGEGLRGYLRGADQMGRSVLLVAGGAAQVAGTLMSDWLTALPEHSSKHSRVSWDGESGNMRVTLRMSCDSPCYDVKRPLRRVSGCLRMTILVQCCT